MNSFQLVTHLMGALFTASQSSLEWVRLLDPFWPITTTELVELKAT